MSASEEAQCKTCLCNDVSIKYEPCRSCDDSGSNWLPRGGVIRADLAEQRVRDARVEMLREVRDVLNPLMERVDRDAAIKAMIAKEDAK